MLSSATTSWVDFFCCFRTRIENQVYGSRACILYRRFLYRRFGCSNPSAGPEHDALSADFSGGQFVSLKAGGSAFAARCANARSWRTSRSPREVESEKDREQIRSTLYRRNLSRMLVLARG